MQDILQLLDEPDTTIALVGATDNPSKYGHTIYLDLKRKGYAVVPVNSHRAAVDGDEAFEKLADLPEPPTIVNFVVPPHVSLSVLAEAKDLGHKLVWMQPAPIILISGVMASGKSTIAQKLAEKPRRRKIQTEQYFSS